MPLNHQTLSAIKAELCQRIIGAKIDKIQQPQRDLIIMTLRGRAGDNARLLISVSVQDTRVHLTGHTFENPISPPMFCMLLRKHLCGARIETIAQPPGERILELGVKTSTALGDTASLRLVLELFGHIPNIILVDFDGIIIDCLRRTGGELGKRMLLPGLRYVLPQAPPQASAQVNAQAPPQATAQVNAQSPPQATVQEPQPQTPQQPQAGSISQLLDATYSQRSKQDAMRIRSASLTKTLKTTQKRLTRKLAAQREELTKTAGRDYLRECADIIMANLHLIKKGDEVLIAEDFYASTPSSKREIALDPLKSPQKNAARYYKNYTKAKNAEEHLKEQIKNGERELEYIGSVLEQISRAESEQDIIDIKAELMQSGYLKLNLKGAANAKNAKGARRIESKPMSFKSAAGIQILAGRNNIQNEKLTFKTASRFDIWLHTQKIHGTHVIIRSGGRELDNKTLEEAAIIAAYYSAARSAGKVPVDYTQVKFVKKQPDTRPGMVLYTDYKTIFVQPDEEAVKRLRD